MEMTGLSIRFWHKKEVVIRGGEAGFHYGNKTFFTRLEVFRSMRRAGVYLKINIKGDIFIKADIFLFIPCVKHNQQILVKLLNRNFALK